MRRRARRLALRAIKFAVYLADCYSATVQYEELNKLSDRHQELRGIARGDLHRHVRDALPKWRWGE
jgi:hypothetical protein